MDPLAEMYSPYVYVGNKPILFHDPDGMYSVDANGNITINDPDEISSFFNYLNNNSGASISDMSNHIISAGKGLSWELDAIAVTGSSSFENGGWLSDAQGLVSDAVGLMGNINSISTSHFGFENSKFALDVGNGLYGAGTMLGGTGIFVDGLRLYNNEITALRFGYHFTGYGASIGAGMAVGGHWGATVGAGFAAGEIVYDTSRQVKQEVFGFGFNQFYRTLINGWLNSR